MPQEKGTQQAVIGTITLGTTDLSPTPEICYSSDDNLNEQNYDQSYLDTYRFDESACEMSMVKCDLSQTISTASPINTTLICTPNKQNNRSITFENTSGDILEKLAKLKEMSQQQAQ